MTITPEDQPVVEPSNVSQAPSIPATPKVCAVNLSKGRKYFISGMLGPRIISYFIDTGAEISILPIGVYTNNLVKSPVTPPIDVRGFNGEIGATIEAKARVDIDFCPGELSADFYICQAPFAIIGADLLQSANLKLSLSTGDGELCVGDTRLRTMSSEKTAINELKRRKRMGVRKYKEEMKVEEDGRKYVKAAKKTKLAPHTVTFIPSKIIPHTSIEHAYSLLSFFDEEFKEIYIPSITFGAKAFPNLIPVHNETSREIEICEGFVFGEIIVHRSPGVAATSTAEVFHFQTVIDEIRSLDEEESGNIASVQSSRIIKPPQPPSLLSPPSLNHPPPSLNSPPSSLNHPPPFILASPKSFLPPPPANYASIPPPNSSGARRINIFSLNGVTEGGGGDGGGGGGGGGGDGGGRGGGGEEVGGNDDTPVKFSSLMDVGKVDSATLEKCRKDGIKFDLELDMVAPQIILDKTKKIKIKEEMEKSESCEYWKEKSHFLNQFELSNVDENQLPKLQNLLWAFRHIFYNESTPAQFRTGLTNIPPIHVARVPGLVPRHEKLRQVPDSKLAHLKKHISNLVQMGVLVPATDISDVYASPVHIVVEKRFIASKNKVEEKSRLTIDARAINETLAKSAYPLPLCDQFRRDIAKRNYKVFSNLDMKEMYHQIKCDQETSRKCFGVHALGRIFLSTRLLMGCKQAPSIAQSIVDQAFDHHENTKPFEDDFTVASTDEETHGQTDLPVAFATASYYNMLMCPRKCIFFAKEARILGHLIGEEKIPLSAEKIEKIKCLVYN